MSGFNPAEPPRPWRHRMVTTEQSLDMDRMLRLRLAVARYGEMDIAGWWNTRGILGRHGQMVLSRGLPRTHHLAQARVAFSVAAHRCREVFNPDQTITLWQLPAAVEDQFLNSWHIWLGQEDQWQLFISELHSMKESDGLVPWLVQQGLIGADTQRAVAGLRRSAQGKAVRLAGKHLDDGLIALLAAAFGLGEKGRPAIPYAVREV